jgi:acetyltransferase EpsM
MKNDLVLYGAGGHSKAIVENLTSQKKSNLVLLDDNPSKSHIFGINVYKTNEYDLSSIQQMVLCIGNNIIRKKVANQFKNISFFSAIHKQTIISSHDVSIGKGTVVMAGVTINPSVKIGEHCIINTGAVVEHDCKIHDFAHICPNVSLAGGIEIGEGTQVGIGSSIIQSIKIGKWVNIGAGCVIVDDIPDYAVVRGNPGKIIKYNKHE